MKKKSQPKVMVAFDRIHDVSTQLLDWIKFSGVSAKSLGKACGLSASMISWMSHGSVRSTDEDVDAFAKFFGVTRSEFLAGPAINNECGIVERLKFVACKNCPAKHRGCATCRLERFYNLCVDVISGKKTLDTAFLEAETLVDDSIDAANRRHDENSGRLFQKGHAGVIL